MAIFINNGGAAKKVSRADSIKVNIGGVARSAKAMKINIGGVAKDVFMPVVNLYRYGVLIQTLICDSNGYVTLPTMSSEYEDDTFYGWSVSSSSTVRTYTAGQKIKSTEELDLYAIYSYTETVITKSTLSSQGNSSSENKTGTVAIDGTITVTGRLVENSVASDKSFPLLTNGSNPYLSIAGVYLNQSISPTPLYVAVKKDNVIKLNGYNNATSSAGPTLIKYVTCTYDSAVSTQTAYRVSR